MCHTVFVTVRSPVLRPYKQRVCTVWCFFLVASGTLDALWTSVSSSLSVRVLPHYPSHSQCQWCSLTIGFAVLEDSLLLSSFFNSSSSPAVLSTLPWWMHASPWWPRYMAVCALLSQMASSSWGFPASPAWLSPLCHWIIMSPCVEVGASPTDFIDWIRMYHSLHHCSPLLCWAN